MSIPSWQPLPVCADARLRHWLLDRGSLTLSLRKHCDCFNVNVWSQRFAVVNRDECAVIGVRPGVACVVRDVSLNCDRRPVIFAHSVAEPRALRGPWRTLTTLGARPLGEALFADPRITRFPLRFRRLNRRHELYRRACGLLEHSPACLWARRSLFALRESRLLVTEVFLPAILDLAP